MMVCLLMMRILHDEGPRVGYKNKDHLSRTMLMQHDGGYYIFPAGTQEVSVPEYFHLFPNLLVAEASRSTHVWPSSKRSTLPLEYMYTPIRLLVDNYCSSTILLDSNE